MCANLEILRPVLNAMEQVPLIDKIGTEQQFEPTITREIERWQEISSKGPNFHDPFQINNF